MACSDLLHVVWPRVLRTYTSFDCLLVFPFSCHLSYKHPTIMSSRRNSLTPAHKRPMYDFATTSLAAYSLDEHTRSQASRSRPRSATTSSVPSPLASLGLTPTSTSGTSTPAAPSLRNIYSAVPPVHPQRKRGNTFSASRPPSGPQSRRSSHHSPHPSAPDLTRILGEGFMPDGNMLDHHCVSEMMQRATLNPRSPSVSPGHSPTVPSSQATNPQENIFGRIESITRPVELTIQTLLFRVFTTLNVEFLRYPARADAQPEGGTATTQTPQTATSGYMCLLLLGLVLPHNAYDAVWTTRVQERLRAVYADPQLLNAEGGVNSVRDLQDLLTMMKVLVSCVRRVADAMVRSGVVRCDAEKAAHDEVRYSHER